jgi:membrane-bound ClpP family serine protease
MRWVEPPEAREAVGMLIIPEVAFLLLASGLLALNVWIAHPHLAVAAALAPVLLVGGIIATVSMPASAAAFYFLVLATGSFLLEVLSLPGMVLHASGGAFSLVLAGLCLQEPWIGAHPGVVLPAAALVGLGTYVAGRQSWRVARTDPFDSSPRLIGRKAVVLTAELNAGHAVIGGAVWPIASSNKLCPGDIVSVIGMEYGRLLVRASGRYGLRLGREPRD